VVSYWDVAATGRRRKYYGLNEAGTAELERLREQWSVVHRALERLAGPIDKGDEDV